MPSTVTPEQAILFTRFSVALVFTWPLSRNSSKLSAKVHDVLWHAAFINSLLLVYPLALAVRAYQDDSIIMTKCLSHIAVCIQIATKMLMCRVLRHHFQNLFSEMEQFCADADEEENDVLQRYVNRYKILYGIYAMSCYVASIIFISGPLFLPQSFPCISVYPFPVDQQPIKTVIYIQQALTTFQGSAVMNVDCQIAIVLWFATVRFEILSLKIQKLQGGKYIDECIKCHQDVLRYAQKVQHTVQYLAASTIIVNAASIAFGGFTIVQKSSIMLKIHLGLAVIAAAFQLFMCALPADCLKHASSQIATDMYSSGWYKRCTEEQTSALQMIMRAQNPQVITVGGLFSELTLHYYSSFLSTAVSYIMSLRVLMGEEEANESY